jgi:hypothetical protein
MEASSKENSFAWEKLDKKITTIEIRIRFT